jgi:hypothetical protein
MLDGHWLVQIPFPVADRFNLAGATSSRQMHAHKGYIGVISVTPRGSTSAPFPSTHRLSGNIQVEAGQNM